MDDVVSEKLRLTERMLAPRPVVSCQTIGGLRANGVAGTINEKLVAGCMICRIVTGSFNA